MTEPYTREEIEKQRRLFGIDPPRWLATLDERDAEIADLIQSHKAIGKERDDAQGEVSALRGLLAEAATLMRDMGYAANRSDDPFEGRIAGIVAKLESVLAAIRSRDGRR